jgi:flagellar hook protein FlgE
MLQAFFNGLSGLFSFSRGLTTVSNNVSNMNTPGFRGNDTFFRNVAGDHGLGTRIGGTGTRLQAGDIRQTGNPMDLALNGSGYFVLRNDQGELMYTRTGQFQFNEDGFLIDRVTGAHAAAAEQYAHYAAMVREELGVEPPPLESL